MYIYEIRSLVNRKRYIGQSQWKNNKRLNQNRYLLNRGTHPNLHLQSAWLHYGKESFKFSKIAFAISFKELDLLEERYIKKYKATDRRFGYNIRPGGHEYHTQSNETKKLIGDANRGNHHTKKLKQRYARERRIYDYPEFVLDPWGKKHRLVSVKGLCKQYGINDSNFRKMLRGEYKHSYGWRKYAN